MKSRVFILMIGLFSHFSYGQILSGRLIDRNDKGLAGCTVGLLNFPSITSSSNPDGSFSIPTNNLDIAQRNFIYAPFVQNNFLHYSVTGSSEQVVLKKYDINGKLSTLINEMMKPGYYTFPLISKKYMEKGVMVFQLKIGNEIRSFKFGNELEIYPNKSNDNRPLTKHSSNAVDTLFVTCNALPKRNIPLINYNTNLGNIQVYKPNILFILVDDMAWNGISSFGNPLVSTPNIDGLAIEGMKFDQAYATPQCSQTRAAFLSGRYGARTGMTKVVNNDFLPYAPLLTPIVVKNLPNTYYNIAKILRDQGYATGLSGKWHVGGSYWAAAVKNNNGGQYFNNYGFDYVGDATEQGSTDKAVDAITDDMITFMEQNQTKPFFAYVSHYTVHTRLEAPANLVDKYVQLGFKSASDPRGDATDIPSAEFQAMTEHLDNSVGRLLQKLDDLNLKEKTLVVFVSDNGASNRAWDSKPLRESKGSMYEGGIKVPLIFRWPGRVPANTVDSTAVHFIDFYPTFTSLAGGYLDPNYTVDGLDISPLFLQTGSIQRDALYLHHPHYVTMFAKTPGSYIRKGDYKLIYYFWDYLKTDGHIPVRFQPFGDLILGERTELFNIKQDPFELNNIATSLPAKTAELKNDLQDWWSINNASLPVPNPDYDSTRWSEMSQNGQR